MAIIDHSATDIRPIEAADRRAVEAFLSRAAAATGGPPLSEHKWIRRLGSADSRVLVCTWEGSVVGYLQAAWHASSGDVPGHWGIEVVVDWDEHAAEARDLVGRVTQDLSGAARLWVTDESAAAHVEAWGLDKVRSLLVLRRQSGEPPPIGNGPQGIEVGTFDREGDGKAWLAVNNAAFEGHPENGALTENDLDERISQPWFDPAGFLVARDDEGLVGFCWTKLHPDHTGEIYIIATAPRALGRGVGRFLLRAALEYLEVEKKVSSVLLYVEADNEPAMALYRQAGFTQERELAQYAVG